MRPNGSRRCLRLTECSWASGGESAMRLWPMLADGRNGFWEQRVILLRVSDVAAFGGGRFKTRFRLAVFCFHRLYCTMRLCLCLRMESLKL